jgi:hypothetical protein
MNTKLSPLQKSLLPVLERKLQEHVKAGDSKEAIEVTGKIQSLFRSDRSHYRLLRAKIWCFEATIDANDLSYSEAGLLGICSRVPTSSRLHIEASTLLAVCFLRRKRISEAKKVIREVNINLKNITSTTRRRQFQKRLVDRIEQECILSELMGDEAIFDEQAIHSKAIELVQSPEDELYEFLARALPPASLARITEIRDYSILQLPEPDRMALPAPRNKQPPSELGKKAFSVIGRIAWRAICRPDSKIYELWSKKVPEVYEKTYFATAIIAALKEWHIGAALFASGIVALAMRHSAYDFCEWTKPSGVMIDRKETD